MAVPASLNPFRTLAAHRNFRIFWAGQTTSQVGTWMQSVGQGWLALELSNDAFMVGLVSAAGSLPVLLLSLFAGVLADRVDKLRLVTVAQSLMLVQAVALWWFAWSGQITIGWLVTLAAAGGVLQAVEVPARQSLVIELVGRDDLLDAIALNSTGFNLARIVGPSLAALVISQLGLAWCFGVNAVSYLAVLTSLLRIRLPAASGERAATSPLEGLREGIRFIRGAPEISTLLRLTGVYSVCGLPYLALMPVFARDVLGLGASGYGALLSFVGVGAITGALALAAVGRRVRRGRLLPVTALGFASLLVALSFVRVPAAAAGVLLLAGLTMILTNAITNGLLQTLSPDAFRGRVMSMYSLLFIGLSPAGALAAGAVARELGVSVAIGGSAVLMLAYGGWTFWRNPAVREL
ncbi:MAG TPA: MFS transporter [Gemmatimonadaceae bacterium]|nr:MFS transporter [Gemmatimonadaceae bacterium]